MFSETTDFIMEVQRIIEEGTLKKQETKNIELDKILTRAGIEDTPMDLLGNKIKDKVTLFKKRA